MKAFLRELGLRFWVTVCVYLSILCVSFYLAYELRFDFALPPEMQEERLRLLKYAVGVKFLCLVLMRQTGSMLRYFSIPDLVRVAAAMALGSTLLILPRWIGQADYVFPRGVLLIDLLLSVTGLCAFRIFLRVYQERLSSASSRGGKRLEEIAIVGAGDSGASLAKEFLSKPSRGFKPVAFFDDDPAKRGRLVHGIPVLGPPEGMMDADLKRVRTVVVAMPSAARKRVKEILLSLVAQGYKVEIMPALEDLASGRAKVSQIRAVDVEDLLGREPVKLDTAGIRRFVEDKVVLVTGAGGSIGSELCRQVADLNPHRLLLLDQSEGSLFLIEQEMNERGMGAIATPVVADILDETRLQELFRRLRPQVVFHAAAHKHVYLMERQPGEAVRNNSVGTRVLAAVAAAHRVEAFVLISTDKAINPTNVMGCSKRLAEIHLQAMHARVTAAAPQPAAVAAGGARGAASGKPALQVPATKFMAVRFGNVLGSSGSVVPIFRRQIAAGGPVTVTHPDVTRYFMTIPEAVGLVLQAAVLGEGGEIFVLDMGQPVKIVDLARQMIELSGFKVDEDIEIKFTGLKPGEKLYEELRHKDEDHLPTSHPRIMRFVPQGNPTEASARAIDQLEPLLYTVSPNTLKAQLKEIVPEYVPHLD
ncbi:MAG TPA: nucleoside-diphosphate sugar epimerase/dehydratase [Opitutaceae bacterium]|nr:nucleoside-diphosphate sugar epimerase/dehydratase [Opitutaceae bacterium]